MVLHEPVSAFKNNNHPAITLMRMQLLSCYVHTELWHSDSTNKLCVRIGVYTNQIRIEAVLAVL